MRIKNILHSSILFCFFICLSPGLLPAQKAAAQPGGMSKVFTKEGNIIYGVVQHEHANGPLTVENPCGIFIFYPHEIDSIVPQQPEIIETNGFFNLTSVGLLFGEGMNGYAPYPTLTSLFGTKWNNRYLAGLGIGFEYYERSVMPVYGQFLLRTSNTGKISPLLSARIGYSFALKRSDSNNSISDIKGGLLLNPEAGIEIRISDKSTFITSIGYAYQELSHNEPVYHWSTENENRKTVYTHINRVSLRIGFRFY